jgi:16S rRNA (adenine1518-N6/adenine1519-N6)-dimethyltransferase
LSHLNIRPSKGLGQNFLFDREIVGRIVDVAGIDQSSVVVEIGAGLGIMTEELLARAGAVIAVELDQRLAAHLRHIFPDRQHFALVEADALKIDLGELTSPETPYQIVANLPYSVAAPITRHALEAANQPSRLTVMVQKEVAERMTAEPPEMSILSVATQFYADAHIAFVVPADVFVPRPKVDSAVVQLTPRHELPLPRGDAAEFFRIVNAGFRQKRKQVVNSLSAELKLPKGDVLAHLTAAGIDPARRAETLAVEDWVRLFEALRE